MAHSHNCHHHSHKDDGNIGSAFFLNLFFATVGLIGGFLTNSIAIISAAIHDFGDCLSLALAWYFQKLSKKGSSKHYSYGYNRFSILSATITSVILFAGSVYILQKVIPRLFSPQSTNTTGMFALALLGVVINTIAVLRTYKAHSINERIVSLHMLEDALGWVAVLVGSVVMHFTNIAIVDPIISVAIACFVLINVVRNVRQILPILLQKTPSNICQEQIVEAIKKTENIANVHDLHIWSLDEKHNILTVHITLKEAVSMEKLAELKESIRLVLKEQDIQHATIEFETPNELCSFKNCV